MPLSRPYPSSPSTVLGQTVLALSFAAAVLSFQGPAVQAQQAYFRGEAQQDSSIIVDLSVIDRLRNSAISSAPAPSLAAPTGLVPPSSSAQGAPTSPAPAPNAAPISGLVSGLAAESTNTAASTTTSTTSSTAAASNAQAAAPSAAPVSTLETSNSGVERVPAPPAEVPPSAVGLAAAPPPPPPTETPEPAPDPAPESAPEPEAEPAQAPETAQVTTETAAPSSPESTAATEADASSESGAVASVDLTDIKPETAVTNADGLSIFFESDSAELPEAANTALTALAQKLATDPDTTVRLIGYAQQIGEQQTQSRRVSLFRALAVRSQLLKEGVDKRRMTVQALGTKEDGSGRSQNRVDLVLSND